MTANYGPLSFRPSATAVVRTSPPPLSPLRLQRWDRLVEMAVEEGENSAFDPDSIIDLETHQMLAKRAQHWRNAAQALRERHPPTER